jgi:hypothetical protein
MMGFIGCVSLVILLHVLSFGIGITGGRGCFGHFEVLVSVGFVSSFGDVAQGFDVFVHFNGKSLVWTFYLPLDYYYIGGLYILKHHYDILYSEGLQL